jgi:hypothetical protein
MKFTVIQDETSVIKDEEVKPEKEAVVVTKFKKKKPDIDIYNMRRQIEQRPDSKDTKDFLNNMIELAKIETQKEIEAIRQEVSSIGAILLYHFLIVQRRTTKIPKSVQYQLLASFDQAKSEIDMQATSVTLGQILKSLQGHVCLAKI